MGFLSLEIPCVSDLQRFSVVGELNQLGVNCWNTPMHLPSILPVILFSTHILDAYSAALAVRSLPHASLVDGPPQTPNPPTTAVTALSKRVLIQDGGSGWLIAWEQVEVMVPVQEAAESLQTLYTTLIDKARGEWSTTTAEHSFSRSIGHINFAMYCQRRPLPWSFIATFAERMLGTMQQSPSLYRIRIYHPNGRTVVSNLECSRIVQCSRWE